MAQTITMASHNPMLIRFNRTDIVFFYFYKCSISCRKSTNKFHINHPISQRRSMTNAKQNKTGVLPLQDALETFPLLQKSPPRYPIYVRYQAPFALSHQLPNLT